MPAPCGHDGKGLESLKSRHIRTKGEVTVTNLERRRVGALVPAHIEALDNSSSLNGRVGGPVGADEAQNEP